MTNRNGALPSMDSELLDLRNLRVTYGTGAREHVAVVGASFALRRGERVAIVGESGSGKTTLALAIAGLLTTPSARVTSDELTFDGKTINRGRIRTVPVRTPGMTMVFQDAMTSLDPVTTIGRQFTDVLRGVSGLKRSAAQETARAWLRKVGLHDTERVLRLRPYELSGGMRQRVMIALAVCSRPRLLIADEPTSALDATISREVMDLLTDVTRQENASLLVVSHDIELCRMYVDRIIVMYHGAIVDICHAASIEQDATHPYTAALLACVPSLDAAHLETLPTLDDVLVREPQPASA
ncbi:MAG: ABC transporter ATP-binding protein [Microbacterium sp.]|uniref:ABC transporter ATP-binding protein n=1 Tax=Microbacterium sp. TaxID=51671 RepID=UPI00271D1743|nr:ABC transporter ATP-binding protein [Microbacterium sp.]MDO8383961.1 ABC transporter ATP-binding protein [Microbacterium sp.]